MTDQDFEDRLRGYLDRTASTPPPAGLQGRILDRPRRRWLTSRPSAPVFAASVIGGVAVLALVALGVNSYGLLSGRNNRPVAAGSPSAPASPSPVPPADYGRPPAGVPVFYVANPAEPDRLQAIDQSGQFVGTIKPTRWLDLGIGSNRLAAGPSPDGSRLIVGDSVIDQDGRAVADLGGYLEQDVIWSNDGEALCTIGVPQGGQGPLQGIVKTRLLQGPWTDALTLTVSSTASQGGPGLAGCSHGADRALVKMTAVMWTNDWWLVSLSGRKVLHHSTFGSESLSGVVTTPDVAYVAENASTVNDPGFPSAPFTVIRSTADGGERARFDKKLQVLAFSNDGNFVLTRTHPAVGAPSVQVIEWRSQKVKWIYQGSQALQSYRALSDTDFVLGFANPPDPSKCLQSPAPGQTSPTCDAGYDKLRDVLIARSDGSSAAVPGRYLFGG